MPRVLFLADFRYVREQRTVAYKAGMKLLVTTPCAREAIAADKARLLEEHERAKPAPIRRLQK